MNTDETDFLKAIFKEHQTWVSTLMRELAEERSRVLLLKVRIALLEKKTMEEIETILSEEIYG